MSESVTAAIGSAQAGHPAVLVIEGGAGVGKSSLIEEVAGLAAGFRRSRADGVDSSSVPYQVLQQWDPLRIAPALLAPMAPFSAAQRLRAWLDEVGPAPALLCLDDLQWADPESVEALTWLMQRMSGDRVLLAVGTRPLSAGEHGMWQRWVRTSPAVRRIGLTGLPEDLATELAIRRRPGLSRQTARMLWAHTNGNPLYLNALLDEYDPAELERMRVLPAPSRFERLTADRLSRLDDDQLGFVRATAVLGGSWTGLPTVAAVARSADPDMAAQRAGELGLVQLQEQQGVLAVRPAHSLVRAAIYYATPVGRRRELHRRAAQVTPEMTTALEHRVHGASGFDDTLAGELATAAATVHDERSHRLAAQYLQWAAALASAPAARFRHQLDSHFERQLAGQRAAVATALAGLHGRQERARVLLLRGADAVFDGRPGDAVRILSAIEDVDPDPADPLPYFRANVLLAWSRMLAGGSDRTILADLDRARSAGAADPAIAYYEFYSHNIASARSSNPEELVKQVAFLPHTPSDVPPAQRDLLAWRGNMRLFMGVVPEAALDMREANERIDESAVTDLHDGGRHAALGVAQWLHGDWDMANVTFRLAREIAERPLPIVLAYLPLHAIGVGDFDEADRLLGQAMETFQRMPWQEAVQQLLIPRVVRAHAGAEASDRTTLLGDMRRRWPRAFADTGLVSSFWFLHAGLAGVWAGDEHYAQRMISRLAAASATTRWATAAAHWLTGLWAERQGDPDTALHQLRSGTAADSHDVPFYRAHMLSDHARVARALGHAAEAERIFPQAQQLYQQLGATPYLAIRDQSHPVSSARASLSREFRLTEREQDVATLIAAGMSYAQIAQELFVTRSTVNYHLGNIYAKVGVRTRHQLSHLLRVREVQAANGPGGDDS